jgi:hypothetical protein
LENDFLRYLEEWDKSVVEREGFSNNEKKKMTLSQVTLEGLRMTGIILMCFELMYLFVYSLCFCGND